MKKILFFFLFYSIQIVSSDIQKIWIRPAIIKKYNSSSLYSLKNPSPLCLLVTISGLLCCLKPLVGSTLCFNCYESIECLKCLSLLCVAAGSTITQQPSSAPNISIVPQTLATHITFSLIPPESHV